MHRSGRLMLLLCCWLGVALRFRGVFANSFHADEALFASWARLIAVWRDPLLLTQAVDKPPLLFYLQALFFPLLGPMEWAARMPSFIASLLLIPLTAQLARRLTGDQTAALIAAAIVAVAPLSIQFSGTAFSDPLLTFWLTATLYAVARPPSQCNPAQHTSAFLAGLLFGLALATKYQALLFVPLVVGTGWLSGRERSELLRGLIGVTIGLMAVLVWQWARAATNGVLALQWANIGGIRPAYSWELWRRLVETATLWRLAFGWPILVVGIGVATAALLKSRGCHHSTSVIRLMALFVAGYSLLHWLWAVPVWDRYLLPILPLIAILMGWGLTWLWTAVSHRSYSGPVVALALVFLTLVQLPTTAGARVGRFPIGGRPDADGGAAEVARLLKDAPYGTVLYDHGYSWHWHYQLFDGRVYVSWFPHTEALLRDLAVFGGSKPARYIVLPSSAEARPVVRRLVENGFRLEPVQGSDGTADMTLYRILVEATE